VETPPVDIKDTRISWFAFVVKLPKTVSRDLVIQRLAARGIESRAYFPPIHKMQLYSGYAGQNLPVTEDIARRTLALPFFNRLQEEEMREVCRALVPST
jgi:perosamine synthetase